MAFVETMPGDRDLLAGAGLAAPGDFLTLRGVIVSGHPTRHVLRVEIGGTAFILKKEHRVRWRDRVAGSWFGFGWVSKSVREARLLLALGDAGVSCPAVAAYGEDAGRAFVLLRESAGMTELRALLRELSAADRRALAGALGRELARTHAAGVDHPDLYAKHVLVHRDAGAFRFCFLDWQRSRRTTRVSWRRRLRDLAALDASLADDLAGDRERLRCLRAYLAAADGPPWRHVAAAIRRRTAALLTRRKIRELRQPPGDAQALLWPFGDERLCITPAFHAALGGALPDWLVPRPHATGGCVVRRTVALPGGRVGCLVRRWSGTSSPAPELVAAATLFRLARFGIAAPRLLAFGQAMVAPGQRFSFVLSEPPAHAMSPLALDSATLRAAGRLLRRLHDAGLRLNPGADPLAAVGQVENLPEIGPVENLPHGAVVLTSIDVLQRTSLPVETLARLDLRRLAAAFAGRISGADGLRFLHGYHAAGRLRQDFRRRVAMFNGWERRAAR
jgi:tRNA A-37 threonylcarbamoyl transferase component Bud32